MAGCGFGERVAETAKTPQPLFDGKTPIQVLISSGEAAARGDYINAIIQGALAIAVTIAGGLGFSARHQARTAHRAIKARSA